MVSSNRNLKTKGQQKVLDEKERKRQAHKALLQARLEESQGNKSNRATPPKKNAQEKIANPKPSETKATSIQKDDALLEFAKDVLESQDAPAVGDAVDEKTLTPQTETKSKSKPKAQLPAKKTTTKKTTTAKKTPVKKEVEQKEAD